MGLDEFLIDKRGKKSAKRLSGLCIVFSSIMLALTKCFCSCNIDETLILGMLTIGTGLLGASMAEKPKNKKEEEIN